MTQPLRTTIVTTAIVTALIAGSTAAGSAAADTEFPTTGDRIQYTFYSDVKVNESAVWYDANNDMQDLSKASLPSHNKNRTTWSGSVRFTSASTYQLTGASIQTSGYFAACRVYVNGTLVAEDKATGRYAMAVC